MSWVSPNENVFYRQNIDEGFKDILKLILGKIKSFFRSLGFGQTKNISVKFPASLLETAGGGVMNKQLGEWAEIVSLYTLEELLLDAGFEVDNPGEMRHLSQQKILKLTPNRQGKTKAGFQYGAAELKKFPEKSKDYEAAGVKIGQQMFKEITEGEDNALCSYRMVHSGEAEAKNSTADVVVQKITEGEASDLIRGSLKVYATERIQFYNGSVAGVLLTLFGIEKTGTIKNLINEYPEEEEKIELLKQLTKAHSDQMKIWKEKKKIDPSIQNYKLSTEFVNDLIKSQGVAEKATHFFADFLTSVIERRMKKDKVKIVRSVFEKMDLGGDEGASTIYANIYGSKKLKDTVISSNVSNKFKKLCGIQIDQVDVEVVRKSKNGFYLAFSLKGENLFNAHFFLKGNASLQVGVDITELI